MNLGTILIVVWIILVNISQYFLNWIVFGRTGLIVIGVIGLVGGLIWLFGGSYTIKLPTRKV
jgi:hypothetical protein